MAIRVLPPLTERDEARFWAKVALPNEQGCMLWVGGKRKGGYGAFCLADTRFPAHRVSYSLAYGLIPEGLELDHLCRVRHCVAPLHLEAVTPAENIRRGEAGRITGALNLAKTHCPQGHPYDEANTRVSAAGKRSCRKCDTRPVRRARRA